jgi:hypothetical protein
MMFGDRTSSMRSRSEKLGKLGKKIEQDFSQNHHENDPINFLGNFSSKNQR